MFRILLVVKLSVLTLVLSIFGEISYVQVSQKKLDIKNNLFSNITTSVENTYATISTSHNLKTKCKAAVIFCSSTLCFYSDCIDEDGNISCKVQPPVQGSYDEYTYTYTLVMVLPYYHVIGSGPLYFEENFIAPIDTDINFVSTLVQELPDHLYSSKLHGFKRNTMSTTFNVTNYFNWRYSDKYDVERFDKKINIIGDIKTKFGIERDYVSLDARFTSITEFIRRFEKTQNQNVSYIFAFEKAPLVEEILQLVEFIPKLGSKINTTMVVVPPRSENATETENIFLLRKFLKSQNFQVLDLFELSFLPHGDDYSSVMESHILPKLCGITVVLLSEFKVLSLFLYQ